jgi:zearalenone synthase (nonreducing iterative type I polyketide synthase)
LRGFADEGQACASSSSAIHLACLSLLTKDIDMAVVGAANIVGYPHSWTSLSKSGVLSDTGNCKTFRDDADGYCRADFVGSVVLKRLEDAEAQNDNVLAVVASSGRNHSGNSSSITTSDAGAQERLFRKILRTARVSPLDVSYVEMHGTGTQIGDPAEMTAVANTFKNRPGRAPLRVGGIKANIGHSEAAAGMSSLLKCIMMLQKNVIPPQAGLPHALNPRYPSLSKINIEIPTEPKEFKPTGQKPRRILLNNFDAAGGNASILLEDYVAPPETTEKKPLPVDPRTSHVIAISAKTRTSFEMNRRNLIQWLEKNKIAELQDVAYTTTARRIHHPIRRAFTASSTHELLTKLEQDGIDAPQPQPQPQQPPVVFIFTGQGSHYGGMGKDLYATCVPFREMADLCASICDEHGFPPFLDIITNPHVNMTTKETIQTQLAVVTLEISLASFWNSCGIQPATVIGHSLGEYVALHVAGVLSLADVLYLAGHRARLLTELCEPDTCGMLAISSSSTAVQELLETKPKSSCSIACINSPNATVVSGLTDDVVEMQGALKVPSKLLSVPYGFHSLQMDPVIDEFVSLVGGVTFSPPKIPVASTLLGAVVDKAGVFNASYMGQQTRQPVDFVGALKAIKLANPVWIEIGPSAVCSSFVRATLAPPAERIMSSLESKTDSWTSVSRTLAGAYGSGVSIDWFAFHGPFAAGLNLLKLPSYSWDLKDYWITYQEMDEMRPTSVAALVTPSRISSCAAYVVQESTAPKLSVTLRASIASPDFKTLIDGHKIRGVSIVPGSAFCEAGLATARYALEYSRRQLHATSRLMIRNVSLKRPLTRKLAGEDGELHTTVEADDLSGDKLHVTWKASSKQGQHDLGSCVVIIANADELKADWSRISYFPRARTRDLVRTVKEGHGHRLQPSILYALFTDTVEYDPAFKCIKEAFVSSTFDEATAEVILNEDPRDTQFVASPYWGESLVHLAGFLVNAKPERLGAQTTFMMDSFESFEQTAELTPGKSYWTYVRVAFKDKDTTRCDVYVYDGEELIMQCSGLRFHEVSNDILDRLVGKPTIVPASKSGPSRASNGADKSHESAQKPGSSVLNVAWKEQSVAPNIAEVGKEQVSHGQEASASVDVFGIILDTIAKATGTKVSDLTDDTVLMDLG